MSFITLQWAIRMRIIIIADTRNENIFMMGGVGLRSATKKTKLNLVF